MQNIRAPDNECYICCGSQHVGSNAFEYDVDGREPHCGANHLSLWTMLGRTVLYNPVMLILPILFLQQKMLLPLQLLRRQFLYIRLVS